MDFWDDISKAVAAMQPRKPQVPLLDEETRRLLTKAKWTKIRQSNLNRARSCMRQQELALREDTFERYSINAVLGIVLHIGLNDWKGLLEFHTIGDWWLDHYFAWVKKENPKVISFRGKPMTPREVEKCILALGQPLLQGMYIGHVMITAMTPLVYASSAPLQQERTLRYVDGEGTKYPITFEGTYDLLFQIQRDRALADFKSYGLLDAFLPTGTAQIKKQSAEANEVKLATQLRHYSWLIWKCGQPVPNYYGYVWPANVVPYAKGGSGYEKGDQRGPPFVLVPVEGMNMVRQWERDLVAFLRTWARTSPRPRMYPQNMGIPQCPSCSFYEVCMRDTQADSLQNNPALQYLFEKE